MLNFDGSKASFDPENELTGEALNLLELDDNLGPHEIHDLLTCVNTCLEKRETDHLLEQTHPAGQLREIGLLKDLSRTLVEHTTDFDQTMGRDFKPRNFGFLRLIGHRRRTQ